MPEHKRSRPAFGDDGAAGSHTGEGATTAVSVARSADVLAELDDLAEHVDGTFVVVVKVTGGKYRRRCYLTAKAAESAAGKAIERGESATVYLAELKPLWRIAGGGGR